jgi:predicted DNA-binding transcriptional regulator AlpA
VLAHLPGPLCVTGRTLRLPAAVAQGRYPGKWRAIQGGGIQPLALHGGAKRYGVATFHPACHKGPVIERYVSRAELAEIMGIHVNTLDRLRAEPGFPQVRWGRTALRFQPSRVLAWAEAHAEPEQLAARERGPAVTRQSTDRLYARTLGPREREALAIVEQRPGITVSELQDALAVGRSRVWQIVGRLEASRLRREDH